MSNLSANHYLVKGFLGKTIEFSSAATEYGINMEKVARSQFFALFKQNHKKPSIEDCGLFTSKDHPYLGASPDGIVKCKCCRTRLVEIKCSLKYQDISPPEVADINSYHLETINGEIKVKKTSPWYYQIQTQMGVCKIDKCDLVFFTRKGISVETVYFDLEFYQKIVLKCSEFFQVMIEKFVMC